MKNFIIGAVLAFTCFAGGVAALPAKADTVQRRDPVVVVLKDILHELKDIKREMRKHR